jgi:hypothetical protein
MPQDEPGWTGPEPTLADVAAGFRSIHPDPGSFGRLARAFQEMQEDTLAEVRTLMARREQLERLATGGGPHAVG